MSQYSLPVYYYDDILSTPNEINCATAKLLSLHKNLMIPRGCAAAVIKTKLSYFSCFPSTLPRRRLRHF